jgi:hypothetical protein
MAKGFTINRPKARRNPERLTLVNPRPRATSGWFSTSRSSSTSSPAENPKRKGQKKRVTRLAKPVGEKAKSAGKKRSTKKSSTRASRSGAKKTQRQRRQPRTAAGKKKTVAKKTVRYGRAVSTRKKAAPKRKRNAAPKRNASTKKAPRGKVWRKGYVTSTGKRVKGAWVKKPKRNPFDAQGRYYTATVGTGKGKRKAQTIPTKKQVEAEAERRKRSRAAKKAAATRAAKAGKKAAPKRKPAKKAPKKKRTAAKRRPAVKRARSKTPRYYRKSSGAPKAGMTWRKGYTRKDGTRVSGMWVKKGGTKKRKKAAAKRKTTYKRKPRVSAGRGRTKTGKITVRRKKTSYMSGGRAGRYRVRTKAKRYGKRKSYLRSYPKRRRVQAKKKTYKRRYPKKYVRRSRGGKVWVKGYTRSDGVKVKGHWMRKPKRGRYAITGSGKARKIAANPGRKRKRNMGRKKNPYKRTGYKGGKIRVKGYSYKHPRTGKIVRVKGHSRKQWYPKRYPRRGKGSKWLKQRDSYRHGLMSKYEAKRFGFAANPGALAMLPTKDQFMAVGKAAGVGAIGFAGSVAIGRMFGRIGFIDRTFGSWSPVVGNVLGGLGMWMAANAIDNPRLNEMKPFLVVGAGVAAAVNLALNVIARGWVPQGYAAWFMPGAGAVEAAPAAAVAPDSPAAGLGQIDVYEAALDGFGDIETDLERELERMSGDDGIFGDQGVFGEYLETPMGAMVEEAFAGGGSGGVGEYLETPMGEYLETPMGAMVEEAYAGMNEYLETPMGEYLETPMGAMVEEAYAGMGAQVEAAYAGLGQASGNGNGWAAFEQSIQANPLMPGFRSAVQSLVRKRIAAGQPLDDAFYAKLGRASAQLAKQKFQQRVQQVQGRPTDLPVERWKAPLLRTSAPTYKKNIGDPSMTPGWPERIPAAGPQAGEGIFFGTGDKDEGVL